VIDRLVARALPGERVVSSRPLTEGLRNTNYRLELGGGAAAVLRLYLADPEACGREAAILAAMAERLPVPRVLHSDATATPPFALLEWLDGLPLHEVLDAADAATVLDLAEVCGFALAQVHSMRFPAPGFFDRAMRVDRPMPAWAPTVLATLAGPAETRLGPELSVGVRRAVESNASLVDAVWSEAVLVHADYKPWNLLVGRAAKARTEPGPAAAPGFGPVPTGPAPGLGATRTSGAAVWQLTGVLDWEFACAGCRLIDFATFLRDEAVRPAGFAGAFADAYRAGGGSLPPEWRRLTRMVDLLNLLQLLDPLQPLDSRGTEDLRGLVAATVVMA